MDAGGKGFFGNIDKNSKGAEWYRQVATQVGLVGKNKPKAILVISAHWESDQPNTVFVTSQAKHPSLFYDYYNFPKETYDLKYPCPGNPELAKKVKDLITKAKLGIECVEDTKRNLDHGVFIPLLLVYPEADIPVVQLSLLSKLDTDAHIKIGEALTSLRDEGVLIIGSGQTTHGKFADGSAGDHQAHDFVSQLNTIIALKPDAKYSFPGIKDSKEISRQEALLQWDKMMHARMAHGREEHLLPLHVVVGASGTDQGKVIGDIWAGQMSLASYAFG